MAATAPTRFAHLHQHTAYSLLDGAARIKELIAWVKETSPDRPAVAMTDHGNMHGAIEFYKAAADEGVKPIIGFEAYVAPGSRFEKRKGSDKLDGGYYHLTLLAKNFAGYQNLCRLSSRAYLEGFYMKPRIDMELLREHSEGVIALSGCLGAMIPRAILDFGPDEGERKLKEHLDIFGSDFFMEIQNHGLEEHTRLNPVLRSLADKYGVGMVATNDGHYVKREDAHAHDVLLAIQVKKMVSDETRFRFSCNEYFVKTPAEMAEVIPDSDYPGALDNTNAVADMIDLELPIGSKRVYQMPELHLPAGISLADQLRVDTYKGLLARYPELSEDTFRDYLACADGADEVDETAGFDAVEAFDAVLLALARASEACKVQGTADQADRRNGGYHYAHLETLHQRLGNGTIIDILERAEYELGVIISMGFADYYLIVADFINWAKKRGIAVGPGRGSGAGSIVAYAIGITNIDPLHFNLLFERFLNPERISMPDFDIDFSDVRRGEVIDYVRAKYGDEKVAHIATFGTMASRAAIKDAARVLDYPYAEADKVSKLIPVVQGKSMKIDDALREVPELKQLYDAGASAYIDVAKTLEGLNRHASIHAAGVVIARHPIQDLAPVFRTGDGPVVVQYGMSSVEELGFIKMDFLGLRTLSFIEATVRIVKDARGIDLDPDSFPQDDAATFELLSRGEAAGVFQFESAGMIDTLKRLKPKRIQDLIAVTALYRPGPMENIPAFIRRHHGLEEIDYSDFPVSAPVLAPILEETQGFPVYQEHVMEIVRAVAGYSLGQADIMRRAMGKKKVEEMVKQRAVFVAGAGENGVGAEEAGRIFDMLERFANYGFPRAHAAAYGVISYQTAYLKAHFPVEFAAALLTVERGDSDKVAHYIADARHLGIEVLAPDINASRADFTPVGDVVRFGLYGIKNVGESAVEHVLRERDEGGPFADLFDFCARIDLTVVNKRAVEFLVKAGAFDHLAPRSVAGSRSEAAARSEAATRSEAAARSDNGTLAARATLLAGLDVAMKWGAARREQSVHGQMSLFEDVALVPPTLEPVADVNELDLLRFEKEALGIYISAHPMASYPGLTEAASCTAAGVARHYREHAADAHNGRVKVVLSGLIQSVVKRPTRKGTMMARFELADESGSNEVVVFGRRFDEIAPLLEEDRPAVVVVEVTDEGEGLRLMAERVIRWDLRDSEDGPAPPEVALLRFDLDEVNQPQLLELRSLLDEVSGRVPVRLELQDAAGATYLYQVDGVRVAEDKLDDIRESFPWLDIDMTIDRHALLAERPAFNGRRPGNGSRQQQAPEVPF